MHHKGIWLAPVFFWSPIIVAESAQPTSPLNEENSSQCQVTLEGYHHFSPLARRHIEQAQMGDILFRQEATLRLIGCPSLSRLHITFKANSRSINTFKAEFATNELSLSLALVRNDNQPILDAQPFTVMTDQDGSYRENITLRLVKISEPKRRPLADYQSAFVVSVAQ